MDVRYEILPFGSAEAEAAAVRRPLVLTVTCSPRHGLDHTVEVAERIAALGHEAVVHLAARMVRDDAHLDELMERLEGCDVFVVGGDVRQPLGRYASAVELLPVLAAHPRRPRRIGIAAYPEGHPLIAPAELHDALARKALLADYMVSQLCFDPTALLRWLERTRTAGIDLPLYAGLPGAVDGRRLLEVSMKIGVGTSVAFLRKQHGLRHLLQRHEHDRLYEALAPHVDGDLGIGGLHFFTFNRLVATLAWQAGAETRAWAANDA